MDVSTLLIFFISLTAIELVYFKIAIKYNIIDHPNHRSSHTNVTIRGGGIIFSIALLLAFISFKQQYLYFIIGLFLISLISFIDDIKTISNRIRIICHLIAVALLFYQLNIYSFSFYLIAASFFLIIGTINAVNFMDGINGITGVYSLVTMLTLYYIDQQVITFTDEGYLLLIILSLLVFNFFNFRKKAKCFAGDVGSVSIAFIMVFVILQLIIKTNDLGYLLFLLIYGLDTTTTIAFRIIRKENILEAHRSHFYQFLVNEKKIPHLTVALLYGSIQAFINYVVINYLHLSVTLLVVILFISAIAFILLRWYFEGIKVLFNIRTNN